MKTSVFLVFSLLIFLLTVSFFFYGSTEYKPKQIEVLEEFSPSAILLENPSLQKRESIKTGLITLSTWNIGAGVIGKNMDYYYYGGTQFIPSKADFSTNFNGILNFVSQNRFDINLFQEVDIESQRSYFNDMGTGLLNNLGFASYFSTNYKNPYIPFPLKSPLGKVYSGLFSSSKYEPTLVQQIPLPMKTPWPQKLFSYKKTILEMRFKYRGKELIVANIQNSDFDKKNTNNLQLKFLADRYLDEYAQGNYVVVAGDFNALFPSTEIEGVYKKTILSPLDSSLFPYNWTFAFNPKKPTNRDGATTYNQDISALSIIDGFLLSPNISLSKFSVHDLNFEFSNHQPVSVSIILN